MASKTKNQENKRNGIIEAAVEAAEELGAAATAFKESWDHVRAARAKGRPATEAAARVGRVATRTAAKAGRTTVRAAKNLMPGRKKIKKVNKKS